MKTIGFIDYYISEWHANNYPEWIKAASEKLGLDFEVKYAYAELDVSPVDGVTTDEWCKNFGAERCMSIKELCEKSDYVIILAPSDPECHLRYAKEALTSGKRTYIDKTFAPDYKTAAAIFDLSDAGKTEIFSTSALRYADELKDINPKSTVETTGGGSNLPEYIIHQVEMVVKKLGVGAVSTNVYTEGDETVCRVNYPDCREATMRYSKKNHFAIASDGNELVKISSDFFAGLIEDILRFFSGEENPVPREETLEVMKIREGVIRSFESGEPTSF